MAQSCPNTKELTLSRDWDPTSLSGEYRVQWVSDTGSQSRISWHRLFLWKTSMLDSSTHTHLHATPGDTVFHPLYGVMVPDTGDFTAARIEKLRAAVDPIFPPVLLLAYVAQNAQAAARDWTVLVLGTVSNRRDGVMMNDGAGLGMWVRQAGSDEFQGFFEPWGIAVDDKGHYCARKIAN